MENFKKKHFLRGQNFTERFVERILGLTLTCIRYLKNHPFFLDKSLDE